MPDLRFFLLSVTHGFTSTVGISRSGTRLNGVMLDQNNNAVDLCASYTSLSLPCPSSVGLTARSSDGLNDVIPLGSLLTAAGISYLDHLGGGSQGGVDGVPKRMSGIVLLVTIDYTNYFLDKSRSKGTQSIDQELCVKVVHRLCVGLLEVVFFLQRHVFVPGVRS